MNPLNPWFLFGALLAALVLVGTGYEYGNKHGVNAQKVEDATAIKAANDRTQAIIDGYNAQIAMQKAEANEKYRIAQASIIKAQQERETFKTNLENEHVKNQDASNRLRDVYAAYGLRFQAEEDARRWNSDRGAEGTASSGSCNAPATVIQLPEAIARNLRQLAFDADQLNDDYRLCYDYANQVDKHL